MIQVNPIEWKNFTLEELREEIVEARKQAKNGQVYTLSEAKKILGV